MIETQLSLTGEECQFLVSLLERTLKESSIEEHRTRTPLYREHVLQEENVIRGLLTKLQKVPE